MFKSARAELKEYLPKAMVAERKLLEDVFGTNEVSRYLAKRAWMSTDRSELTQIAKNRYTYEETLKDSANLHTRLK